MAEATYSISSASASLSRGDLQSFLGFSPTGPRRGGAARLGSGQSIYSLSSASVERDPATLCGLGPTVLSRSVSAALLRLTIFAMQLRSNDAGPLRGVIPLSLLSVHRDQAPLRLLDYAAI